MRHSNALFQLGMDLDCRSSTAHAEDIPTVPETDAAPDERPAPDHFVWHNGVEYAGRHLIVDLWQARRLDDLDYIDQTLRRSVAAAGATLLHIHLHHFTPNGGVSGVAVLAESHISIHTWPERGYAAMDVFMCGDADPRAAVQVIQEALGPGRIEVSESLRGRTG